MEDDHEFNCSNLKCGTKRDEYQKIDKLTRTLAFERITTLTC